MTCVSVAPRPTTKAQPVMFNGMTVTGWWIESRPEAVERQHEGHEGEHAGCASPQAEEDTSKQCVDRGAGYADNESGNKGMEVVEENQLVPEERWDENVHGPRPTTKANHVELFE